MISPEDQYAGILPKYRPFIRLNTMPLEDSMMPTLVSFWEAVNLLCPLLRMSDPIQVFFGANRPGEFETDFGSPEGYSMKVNLGKRVFGLTIERMVFYEIEGIAGFAPEARRALFLHELIHSMMNVHDEKLNNKIVLALCPGICVVNDRYFFPVPGNRRLHVDGRELAGVPLRLEGGNGSGP